jgi:hypothetical protein
MCGHLNAFPDWAPGGTGRRHLPPPPVDPQILADQQASIAASQAAAVWNRKRAASALVAGSRAVIGQRSALGAVSSMSSRPATGGVGGGAYGGSVLGSAAGGGR